MAVRRESVLLDVEGNFNRKMLENAAAVEVVNRSLKDLSGQSVQTSRATKDLERDIDKTGQTARRSARDVDSYAGKVNVLWSAIAAGAPAAIPFGAVGIGGIAGIANDAGAATLAVGSLVVAMHGVAPAIKAVNKAALEPTAANLQAARLAMEQLSPAARSFVREFQGVEPILHQVQASAASGWFPGLTEALHNLIPLAPVIEKIFHDIGKAGGDLAAQGANSLAGPKWHDFFQFVDTQMPKALTALGHVVGSLAHGLAGLWESFSPLNNSFNDWLVKSARSFDTWATGLSRTQGFHSFLDYLHQNGPKVAAAFEAIAKAVLAIIQAAAPLGGPTLDAITGIANAIAKIANSPLGTPILALLQIASVARIATKAMEALRVSMLLTGEAKVAGAAGGAGVAARNPYGLAAVAGIASATQVPGVVSNLKAHHSPLDLLKLEVTRSPIGQVAGLFGVHLPGMSQDANKAAVSVKGLGLSLDGATGSMRSMQHAIAANRVALAGAFDAETSWRAALVAADKQAKTNNAGIKGSSAAVLANRAALAQLRDAWNNQSAAVQGSLVKQAQARDSFIKTATAMGVPIKKARELAQQLLGIPTHINPIINILAHTQGIDEVLHKMQMLHDKTVNVWTYMYTVHKPGPGQNGSNNSLSGIVPGHKALGGTIPKDGRPYADRYLTLLAPGEEVISNRNGQADRHRALLKAINANRMASGGTVGRSYGGGSSTVRHVIEVKVTGEMDFHRAKAQIEQVVDKVSRANARDEVDQQSAFDERY